MCILKFLGPSGFNYGFGGFSLTSIFCRCNFSLSIYLATLCIWTSMYFPRRFFSCGDRLWSPVNYEILKLLGVLQWDWIRRNFILCFSCGESIVFVVALGIQLHIWLHMLKARFGLFLRFPLNWCSEYGGNRPFDIFHVSGIQKISIGVLFERFGFVICVQYSMFCRSS